MTQRGVNKNQIQQSKGLLRPFFLGTLASFLFGDYKAVREGDREKGLIKV